MPNINRLLKHFCSDAVSSREHMKTLKEREGISKELASKREYQIAEANFNNNESVKFLNDLRRFFDHTSLCYAYCCVSVPPIHQRKYNISFVLDKNQLLKWHPNGHRAWSEEALKIINQPDFQRDSQIDIHVEKYLELFTKYCAEFSNAVYDIYHNEIEEFKKILEEEP